MAEAKTSSSLEKRPAKGILKKGKDRSLRPRFEENTSNAEDKEGVKWDEMNILSTNHPADKDYGHMKIDEPKTPYRYTSSEDESEGEGRFLKKVNERLTTDPDTDPEVTRKHTQISETYSDSEDELTEEAKERKKAFRQWRKKHYDEFHKVKEARALLARTRMDDEEEDEVESTEKPEVEGRMETDI